MGDMAFKRQQNVLSGMFKQDRPSDPGQAFLKANVEVVDPGVTASLLASYGRMDDLLHFASYRQARSALCPPFASSTPPLDPPLPPGSSSFGMFLL